MRTLAFLISAAALIGAAALTSHTADAFPLWAPQEAAGQAPAAPIRAADLGERLIAGLKATPGCLGVDSASTDSGKNLIFAWFENKKAVLSWLNSDAHKTARNTFGFPAAPADYAPLAGVADDAGPLMCVAAVTFPRPDAATTAPPVPLFSIEVYTPVTPGLHTAPTANFSPTEVERIFRSKQKGNGESPTEPYRP